MPKQCGAFRIVRAENLHGFGKSNDNMSVSRIGPHIRSGSILLQKSAAADGPVGHSLRAAGVGRSQRPLHNSNATRSTKPEVVVAERPALQAVASSGRRRAQTHPDVPFRLSSPWGCGIIPSGRLHQKLLPARGIWNVSVSLDLRRGSDLLMTGAPIRANLLKRANRPSEKAGQASGEKRSWLRPSQKRRSKSPR